MSEPGGTGGPRCAFCDGTDLGPIMDFGQVALAGAFLKKEQLAGERKYPMRLYFCRTCFAVQIIDHVPPDVLFTDYFYFSSSIGTLRAHFKDYAADLVKRFLPRPKQAAVLEFGCNDGVLLKPLADSGIGTVIGVDPATNVVASIADPRVTVVNDYFTEAVAERIVAEHGELDMVMANNVYAHITDIQGVTRAVKRVLKPDGVFVFEVHYLGKVVDEMQYDMIYHEHLYYYSLLSAIEHFARYDMVVFDVKQVPIHAGSIRFLVCKKGGRHAAVSAEVAALREHELARGFARYETFRKFSLRVAETKRHLLTLLERLRKEGKRIAGYGASGRANTMIQYCGISHEHIDYMIDDAPAKIGFYTPGSHFLIRPSSVLREPDPPDYLLIFAWSFFAEIRKRNEDYLQRGGRMILPLPDVSIHPAA